MKVVCESCQAKYQVPDERVAGKKLKIRCKRCGATVLIRGDLTQTGLSDSPQPAASAAPPGEPAFETEWHASVDGQSFGPFDTTGLLRWLQDQAAGWDAHVWREGFVDWQLARDVSELAVIAGTTVEAAVPPAPEPLAPEPFAAESDEEEGPTRTFSSGDIGASAPQGALSSGNGARSPDMRSRAASVQARSTTLSGTAPWSMSASGPAAAASPRVTAAQAMTGERNEDSVLFSTANLQQVAMTTSQPGYSHSANAAPGFASGDASGLIDIRALASLARQTTPQITPQASYDRFRADDDSRLAVMNQTGAFNRVDSLAPVSTSSTSSSAAVPLAILGGFALVAAAAFAAILITRESEPAQAVVVVPDTPTPTHAAQPTVTPEPGARPTPPAAEPAPEPSNAPAAAAPAAAADDGESEEELAAKKRQRTTTRIVEEEKKEVLPVEKAKPKKEEKAAPAPSDEVMMAEKPAKAEHPVTPPPAATPAPVKQEPAKSANTSEDIDALLAAAPPKSAPAKSNRSIDDLLSGAADAKKPAAPAPVPAAAPAAAVVPAGEEADLPPSPSRDETLAAMRGVESAVRACGGDQPLRGTAEVQITVAGTTGRVTNATVSGITGEQGSCIARAARAAKFPRFSKPTFSIKYPYRF